jgi:pSer/pThr/pTyr-binding forkhead associated (FHA) protein
MDAERAANQMQHAEFIQNSTNSNNQSRSCSVPPQNKYPNGGESIAVTRNVKSAPPQLGSTTLQLEIDFQYNDEESRHTNVFYDDEESYYTKGPSSDEENSYTSQYRI